LRLLCFPHAGAGASVFRRWPSLLPPGIECCAIQLPGREQRIAEQPFSRLQSLVEALARALEPLLASPFAFFGNSMGALIAFELARYLRGVGRPGPTHLFVAARAAPQLADPRPPIHDLPAEAFACEITRLNGTPAEVLAQEELMSLMMPLLRADFAVCETYRYTGQPPLECPISAFAGLRDNGASPAVVAEWASQTTSRFRLRLIEGDHFFVQKAAAAVTAGIAEELLDTMRIQEGAGGRVIAEYHG